MATIDADIAQAYFNHTITYSSSALGKGYVKVTFETHVPRDLLHNSESHVSGWVSNLIGRLLSSSLETQMNKWRRRFNGTRVGLRAPLDYYDGVRNEDGSVTLTRNNKNSDSLITVELKEEN